LGSTDFHEEVIASLKHFVIVNVLVYSMFF